MKIRKTWQKVCVSVLGLMVLLFAGYGVKTAADEIWGGHTAVEEINHNIDLLSGNLDLKTKELEKAKDALNDAEKNNSKLEEDLAEKKDLLRKNEHEIGVLLAEVDKLGREKNNDKFVHKQEIADMQEQIDKLKLEDGAHQAEIDRLGKENKNAQQRVSILNNKIKNREKQIEDLKNKIAAVEAERDTANQNNQNNDDLLRQAEEDAQGTLKKSRDALDHNGIEAHWHSSDSQGNEDNQD